MCPLCVILHKQKQKVRLRDPPPLLYLLCALSAPSLFPPGCAPSVPLCAPLCPLCPLSATFRSPLCAPLRSRGPLSELGLSDVPPGD
eukprot:1019199-Prorocentrum_minimum.AAC.2